MLVDMSASLQYVNMGMHISGIVKGSLFICVYDI